MAGLTHTGKIADDVCLLRICKVPEGSNVVNGDGRTNVSEANHTGTTITQYSQLTSLVPPSASVCLNSSNIKGRLRSTPFFGNELIGARSIAESAHLIPSGMLPGITWRPFKVLRAICARVLNVIDKSPALGRSDLSFIWTRNPKAMLVSYRMRSIVIAVFGSPLTMTRLAAKTRLGKAVVWYRILDPALNTVLGWHVAKIVNKTYHGGSMSIAIACDIEGYSLDLCELDKDYFEAGKKRLEAHQAQPRMFDAPKHEQPIQLTIE